MQEMQGDYKERLKSLAQNYYGKILAGKITEAEGLLKELAQLHSNHHAVIEK